jgi:hypothetical protein
MAKCKVCRNVGKTFKIRSGTFATATADVWWLETERTCLGSIAVCHRKLIHQHELVSSFKISKFGLKRRFDSVNILRTNIISKQKNRPVLRGERPAANLRLYTAFYNLKVLLLIHRRAPPKNVYSHSGILTVLPFDKVALAFMWLAPSFERISRYTTYITFRFNLWLCS